MGRQAAIEVHDLLASRGISSIDSPVSGGVSGAEKGTLAVMVSAPRADFELLTPLYEIVG